MAGLVRRGAIQQADEAASLLPSHVRKSVRSVSTYKIVCWLLPGAVRCERALRYATRSCEP